MPATTRNKFFFLTLSSCSGFRVCKAPSLTLPPPMTATNKLSLNKEWGARCFSWGLLHHARYRVMFHSALHMIIDNNTGHNFWILELSGVPFERRSSETTNVSKRRCSKIIPFPALIQKERPERSSIQPSIKSPTQSQRDEDPSPERPDERAGPLKVHWGMWI